MYSTEVNLGCLLVVRLIEKETKRKMRAFIEIDKEEKWNYSSYNSHTWLATKENGYAIFPYFVIVRNLSSEHICRVRLDICIWDKQVLGHIIGLHLTPADDAIYTERRL